MNERELDTVLELARDEIGHQVREMIGSLYIDDFTMQELVAVAAVIRPVWERTQEILREPAPVVNLEAVRSKNAKVSRCASQA